MAIADTETIVLSVVIVTGTGVVVTGTVTVVELRMAAMTGTEGVVLVVGSSTFAAASGVVLVVATGLTMTRGSNAGGGFGAESSSVVANSCCDNPGTVSSSSWHCLASISSAEGVVFTGVCSSSKSSTNIGPASSSVAWKDCSYISWMWLFRSSVTSIDVDGVGSGIVDMSVGLSDCRTLRKWSIWSSENLLSAGGLISSIFAVMPIDTPRSCWNLLFSLGCKPGCSSQSWPSQVPGISHTHRGSPSLTF